MTPVSNVAGIGCENNVDDLYKAIRKHVGDSSTLSPSWKITKSIKGGRGVFATRDINVNETIFYDIPLIVGPTNNSAEAIVCVNCYQKVQSNNLCDRKCGLPRCKELCPREHEHLQECELLRAWHPKNPDKISFTKINGLAIVRVLFVSNDAKQVLQLLQHNHSIENEVIENLANEYEAFPTDKATIDLMKLTASVRNTNAFKTLLSAEGDQNISVSGLYPLTGILNHKCTPNTRHSADDRLIGNLTATRNILKGEELYVTYSQLLWNTPTRQAHMTLTKQFLCSCERCQDPTENGTFLSAIKCLSPTCTGYILPIDPLKLTSAWICDVCKSLTNYTRVVQMQEVLANLLSQCLRPQSTPSDIVKVIERKLSKLLPLSNQYIVEMKLAVIWRMKCNHEGIEQSNLIKKQCGVFSKTTSAEKKTIKISATRIRDSRTPH